MSRHPLPETAKTRVEKHIKAVTELDHAVVLEKIAAESAIDPELKHLIHTIKTGTWDKKDPILKPYADLQAEINKAEDVILRLNKIIPPEKLREKIIRITHNQGHLGLSKTKEMICYKYWWPGMNAQIVNAVKRCFECHDKKPHTERAKMTDLPARPWAVG